MSTPITTTQLHLSQLQSELPGAQLNLETFRDFQELQKRINGSKKVTEGITIFCCILALLIITKVYNREDWLAITWLSLISGTYAGIFISSIAVWGTIRKILLKANDFTKTTYENKEKEYHEALCRVKILEYDIATTKHKVREETLEFQLNECLEKLKKNSSSFLRSDVPLEALKEEYDALKKKGFKLHQQRYYAFRLREIKSIVMSKVTSQEVPEIPLMPLVSGKAISSVSKPERKTQPSTGIGTQPSLLTSQAPHKINASEGEKEEEGATFLPNVNETDEVTSVAAAFKGRVNSKKTVNGFAAAPKTDFEELNSIRTNIGDLGEQFVLQYEKARLEKSHMYYSASKVKRVSDQTDMLGYDILSFDGAGNELFIEVKTTTQGKYAPFFLTANEYLRMQSQKSYFIYRVYDFDLSRKEGRLFIIDCASDLEKFFDINPFQYRISPK